MKISEIIDDCRRRNTFVNIAINDNRLLFRFGNNAEQMFDLENGYTYECDGFDKFTYDDDNDYFSFKYNKPELWYFNGEKSYNSIKALKEHYSKYNLIHNFDDKIIESRTKLFKRKRFSIQEGTYESLNKVDTLNNFIILHPVIKIIVL